jgi:16S rRNA (cytosine1402-N4)-methyltransferase
MPLIFSNSGGLAGCASVGNSKVNTDAVEHIPVLCDELCRQISLPQDAVLVDATVGHGGHGFLFGKSLGPAGTILGLDVDQKCLDRAQVKLSSLACRVILVRANFADLPGQLDRYNIGKVDFILADLGFCSAQLTDVRKGLSFQQDMPLDMRLDDRLTVTAADIVNGADEKTLADLIYRFGQDRASRRIARFIVCARRRGRIGTTGRLAELVCAALGQPARSRKSRIHPATRTFQALRIAVNNELANLGKLLEAAPAVLKTGGYIAVIAFHSLEDRLAKNDFKQNATKGVYEVLTAKPVRPGGGEIAENPRARSAKLRIARKK